MPSESKTRKKKKTAKHFITIHMHKTILHCNKLHDILKITQVYWLLYMKELRSFVNLKYCSYPRHVFPIKLRPHLWRSARGRRGLWIASPTAGWYHCAPKELFLAMQTMLYKRASNTHNIFATQILISHIYIDIHWPVQNWWIAVYQSTGDEACIRIPNEFWIQNDHASPHEFWLWWFRPGRKPRSDHHGIYAPKCLVRTTLSGWLWN